MRFAYLVPVLSLLIPQLAQANSCPANDLQTASAQQLPRGCPIVAYARINSGSAATLDVERADETHTSLSLPLQQFDATLPVEESVFNYTSCEYDMSLVEYDFERYEFDTSSLTVGDTVVVSTYNGVSAPITIVAAGTCPAVHLDTLDCSPEGVGDPAQCDGASNDHDDGGGCSVASPGLLLGALALLLRRKNKTATP